MIVSSLTCRAKRFPTRLSTDRGRIKGRLADVSVAPIDEITEGQRCDVMKLDVEGFEGEALAGATRALESGMVAAIVEHSAPVPADSPAHAAMVCAGFSAFSYDPFARRLTALPGPVPGNTIYVRDLPEVEQRVARALRRQVVGIEF